MKRILLKENVIVGSRHYKAGEHLEGDMDIQDFDELIKTGHGVLADTSGTIVLTLGIDGIRGALPDLPDKRLFQLMLDEQAGKNRKTVLKSIEEELERRGMQAAGDEEVEE